VATNLNNLGLSWYVFGNLGKAIDCIQQAYNIFQEIFGDQHADTKNVKEALNFLKDKNK